MVFYQDNRLQVFRHYWPKMSRYETQYRKTGLMNEVYSSFVAMPSICATKYYLTIFLIFSIYIFFSKYLNQNLHRSLDPEKEAQGFSFSPIQSNFGLCTGCPTSNRIVISSKLRFSLLIGKFK